MIARRILDRLTRFGHRAIVARIANIPLGDGRFLSLGNRSIIEPKIGLVVIGAAKAGTTSLHDWLDLHPDIHMSSPTKEPAYFWPSDLKRPFSPPVPEPSVNMRLNMLKGYRGEKLFGEATPGYTITTVERDNPIPERAFAHNPAIRLIYSVRNPYARMISAVNQDIHMRRAPADMAEIPDDRLARYLSPSLYARHLSNWLEYFPREQVKVVLLEEFGKPPLAMMNEIADFVGLEPFPKATEFAASNVTSERTRKAAELKLSPEQFARVSPQVEKSVDWLSDYLGRDLRKVWDLSAERWARDQDPPRSE
ncbi:sulfotransferase domain-containing protein [Sphingomonas sp.]|uniref:sulfotransferase domain-containing protein n=1 Tax=Sphingomonas sp. TaxID=28214 RepID=UPI0025E1DDB4|nr:sulfotransferase domain-containing protein [Sphingomonas sp.]MBV9527026.1 sulfotransferase domain-containing protein [Sphingomonas sp.]